MVPKQLQYAGVATYQHTHTSKPGSTESVPNVGPVEVSVASQAGPRMRSSRRHSYTGTCNLIGISLSNGLAFTVFIGSLWLGRLHA